jgi:hypothetical protein
MVCVQIDISCEDYQERILFVRRRFNANIDIMNQRVGLDKG